MNTIYKVIWNAATQSWVAAPEFSKSRGKKGQQKKTALALAASMAIALGAFSGASFAADADATVDIERVIAQAFEKSSVDQDEAKLNSSPVQPQDGYQPNDYSAQTFAIAPMAANGNGSLQLCPPSGNGSSHGYAGGSTSMGCGGLHSFSLNNNGDASGANGFSGSTARVTGYQDGRLELKGDAGVSIIGPAKFDSDVAMSGKKITGMAAGTADTDAVNFGQLKNTAGSVAAALGGGAVGNIDGTVSAPSYSVGGATVNSVGDAITNLDGRTISNTTAISTLTSSLHAGTIGLVQQNPASDDITVGRDKAGTVVNFTGTDGNRVLRGVAAGTADTDAVNFGQLKNTAGSVAAALGGGSVGNADGTVSAPSYSVQGGTQNNVGAALDALDTSVSSNTANYNNLSSSIANGTIGLVQQASNAADISVAGHRGGMAVDFAGTSGNRVLRGVADGTLSATSAEAVNGSQLFTTNTRIDDLIDGNIDITGMVKYDDASEATLTLGGASGTVISNVADGSLTATSTEAVNGSQLFATNTRIDDLIDGSIDIEGVVKYDDASEATLTLGGASGTVISNVADGELSATSSEAVNGAQLHATNEKVQDNADAITNLDASVTNIDGRVTQNTTDITEINNKLENGSIGLVQHDAATGTTTVAGGLGGGVVDFSGQDGVRRLTGLANGTDDTDAVTLAQLKAAGLVDEDGNALGAVVYDDMSLDKVTLGGVNGTVIGNLGNGLIAAGSREAINGGQLWDLKENLEGRLDNLDGRVDIIEKEVAEGGGGGGGGGDWDNDAGGKPIHNVGDGVADSDAATVGQVNKKYDEAVKEANGYTDTRFDQLQGEFNDRFEVLDGRIDRMAALSGAYAGMAMNTAGLAGKNRVGAGVGAQNGKTALAVGYQRIVGQKNNASVSIGGAFSGSEKSVSAGAGFSW